MFLSCCDKDSSILFTTSRRPDVVENRRYKLMYCKCSNTLLLSILIGVIRITGTYWIGILIVTFQDFHKKTEQCYHLFGPLYPTQTRRLCITHNFQLRFECL
jgi:hypothetical protein